MENKRILMATMGMDIGGAETHILELSKSLVAMGHDVTVASNGGAYVGALVAAGVKHVAIPMHRRSAVTMYQSLRALKRLLRQESFDVVHAHARIPSFLVGLALKRRKNAPVFVTTAHGMFAPGGLVGKLSNWGEKTIAVSDDIAAYLAEHYGMPHDNIFRTVNGIDTSRFSPDASEAGGGIRAELHIPADAPVLVHVSRLDADPSAIAAQLIRVSDVLIRAHPDLHIIIVGGGDAFDTLSTKADAKNVAIGQTRIHMTGARLDVADIIRAATVFVGVSRAALEAMSSAKPVILAGWQGYIGRFDSATCLTAKHTNFCGRGIACATDEQLADDICACLDLSDTDRDALGAYGRAEVEAHYSIAAMTAGTIRAYEAALARPKRLLISGYYGFQNAGDEAILDAFLKSIKTLNTPVQATVLSNTPEKTAATHGVRAVYRFHLLSVLRAVRRTDVLISGGGSLLQDKSSTRSILYYLAIIRLAQWMKKPVMLYANGIGPVDRPRNRRRVRRALKRVRLITLREESSRDELIRIGVNPDHLRVTADPIFLLQQADHETAKQVLLSAGVVDGARLIGVSVRALRALDTFPDDMAALCDRIYRELGLQTAFIVMQTPADELFSKQIIDRMQTPAYLLPGMLSAETFVGLCAAMDAVVSMRLHTLLFAAKAKTPTLGLICDPKIDYFTQKLQMPSAGAVEQFDPDAAFHLVRELLDNRVAHQESLARIVREMEDGALENGRLLDALLRGL